MVLIHDRWRQEGGAPDLYLVGKNGQKFSKPGVRVLGSLDPKNLVKVLSQSFALIFMSQEESAPMSILEAAATQTPTLVPRGGRLEPWVLGLGVGIGFDSEQTWQSLKGTLLEAKITMDFEGFRKMYCTDSVLAKYNSLYAEFI